MQTTPPTENFSGAAVVFDFDGTLRRGDSVGDFLRWRLLRNPLRAAPALFVLPLLWWWLRGPIADRGRAASALLWLATVGLSAAGFERCIARFARQHSQGWLEPAAAALDQHLEQDGRVIVATAAFAPLARALLDLRWPQLSMVGSSLRRFAGGWVAAHHLHGSRKVQALIGIQAHPPFAHAYSDSRDDLPLVKNAAQATRVHPITGVMQPWR